MKKNKTTYNPHITNKHLNFKFPKQPTKIDTYNNNHQTPISLYAIIGLIGIEILFMGIFLYFFLK